jgi:hypothetical protein
MVPISAMPLLQTSHCEAAQYAITGTADRTCTQELSKETSTMVARHPNQCTAV